MRGTWQNDSASPSLVFPSTTLHELLSPNVARSHVLTYPLVSVPSVRVCMLELRRTGASA